MEEIGKVMLTKNTGIRGCEFCSECGYSFLREDVVKLVKDGNGRLFLVCASKRECTERGGIRAGF